MKVHILSTGCDFFDDKTSVCWFLPHYFLPFRLRDIIVWGPEQRICSRGARLPYCYGSAGSDCHFELDL